VIELFCVPTVAEAGSGEDATEMAIAAATINAENRFHMVKIPDDFYRVRELVLSPKVKG